MPDPVVTAINAGGTADAGAPATIVGGQLTFVGTGFTDVTDVLFPTFDSDWESADALDVRSDTRIDVKIPSRAITGAPKLVKGGEHLSAVSVTIHGFGEISEYLSDDGQERTTGFAMSRIPGDAKVYTHGSDERFEGATRLADYALLRGELPAAADLGAIGVVPVAGNLPVGVYQFDGTIWQPLPASGLDTTDAHVTNSAPDDVADAGGTIPSAAPIDHKHGREGWGTLPDVAASAPGDSAVRGVSGREAWSDHRHARTDNYGSAGSIAASAPGDTAAAGVNVNIARIDHKHPREAFGNAGNIAASAPGDTADAGATTKVADAGHRHPREAFSLLADVSTSTPGDAAVKGTSGRVSQADHVHARADGYGTVGNVTNSAPGDAKAVGTSPNLSRVDHLHGRESWGLVGDVSASAPGDTAVAGAVGKIADAGHRHAREAFGGVGFVTTSAVGDAAAAGTQPTLARVDHRHGREVFGSPVASAVGDAGADGTAATLARADHKHGRESFGTPAIVLGTVAAAGVAATPMRSDGTIVAFDVTAPVTQAMGDAAATGAAAVAARRDHKHGMPAFGTNAILLGTAAAAGAATTPMRSNDTIAAFDATVPSTSAVADAAATGSAAFAARRDHVHGREAFGAVGFVSASAPGDAASAGTQLTPARVDHRHGREAFGSPVAVGTANADGAATTLARSNHVHQLLAEHVPAFSKQGALATAVGALRWYNDTGRTLTIVAVRASVGTAPTGASIIVDVNKNGTTIYTTQGNRPAIAISGNTIKSTNPDVTTLADGDYLTVDIDQIGSTIAGSDLTVEVLLRG